MLGGDEEAKIRRQPFGRFAEQHRSGMVAVLQIEKKWHLGADEFDQLKQIKAAPGPFDVPLLVEERDRVNGPFVARLKAVAVHPKVDFDQVRVFLDGRPCPIGRVAGPMSDERRASQAWEEALGGLLRAAQRISRRRRRAAA